MLLRSFNSFVSDELLESDGELDSIDERVHRPNEADTRLTINLNRTRTHPASSRFLDNRRPNHRRH